MNVQVLHLTLKLVHDSRDLLQVHGVQSFIQSFGHLGHVLGHLKNAEHSRTVNVLQLEDGTNRLFTFKDYRTSKEVPHSKL